MSNNFYDPTNHRTNTAAQIINPQQDPYNGQWYGQLAISQMSEAFYPSGTLSIPSSNAQTTLTVPLTANPLVPTNPASIPDIKAAVIAIANTGTSQTITGATLTFTEVVGGQLASISYALSGVSIAQNTISTFTVSFSNGIFKNAALTVTFGAAPTAGSVGIQVVFQGSSTSVGTTTGASVALVSPPANTNAGSDTVLTFAQQAKHFLIQNNTSVTIYIMLDAVSSTAGVQLLPGAIWRDDIPVTSPHIYTAAAQPINAANGIIVEGWL